jgi:hypothetical protein
MNAWEMQSGRRDETTRGMVDGARVVFLVSSLFVCLFLVSLFLSSCMLQMKHESRFRSCLMRRTIAHAWRWEGPREPIPFPE